MVDEKKRMLIIMLDAYFDSRLTINRVNRARRPMHYPVELENLKQYKS